MKKVFSFVAIATMTMFAVSCGNDAAEAQRKADSTKAADSTRNAFVTDSTAKAVAQKRMDDSIANVAAMAEQQRIADSTAEAAKKPAGNKPKPKPTPKPNEPKVGGHR